MMYFIVLNISKLLSFQHVITINIVNEIFAFGGSMRSELWCAFPTYSTSQFSTSVINSKGSIAIVWLVLLYWMDSAVWRESGHKGWGLERHLHLGEGRRKGASEGIDR